jgi:hypothetical protein
MPENGALIRQAALAACLVLVCVPTALAQQPDQPVAVPAPATPQFLSRGDFQVSGSALSGDDPRFAWDTHWGGSVDLVDYVYGRLGVYADYEAVLGSEFRIFDPNQGNYTLEANASARANDTTEIAAMFHHVSRHLADRSKRVAVAMNLLGVRGLKHFSFESTTLDVDLEGGRILQHAFVDYLWMAEAHLQVRHSLNEHVAVFGRGMAQWVGTRDEFPARGRQWGGFIEGGVRLKGTGAAMELFAGVERRVDADPLGRLPVRWALAGLRLVSR